MASLAKMSWLALGLLLAMENPVTPTDTPRLIGTWKRTGTAACAEKYPATLTFAEGTYRGTRGPGQGMIWWDAGSYHFDGPHTLALTTATDALVRYEIRVEAAAFEVVDPEGCRFRYERVK